VQLVASAHFMRFSLRKTAHAVVSRFSGPVLSWRHTMTRGCASPWENVYCALVSVCRFPAQWWHDFRRAQLFSAGGGQMHTVVGLHQDRFHRHLNHERYQLPFQRQQSTDGQRFQRRPLVFGCGPACIGLHPVVPGKFNRTVYRRRHRSVRSSRKRRNGDLHERSVESPVVARLAGHGTRAVTFQGILRWEKRDRICLALPLWGQDPTALKAKDTIRACGFH
jgi:hypothetical protein